MSNLATFESLGHFIELCVRKKCYSNWTIEGIERLFLPPIQLDQYGIFFSGSDPVGFFSWARLTEDASNYLLTHGDDPRPYEWSSGSVLWIIDFVCLPGYVREAAGIVRNRMFSSENRNRLGLQQHIAYSLRRDDVGSIRKAARWKSSGSV